MFDNMTSSRAHTVSTCCNGLSLWRPRAVRQSLPAFEVGSDRLAEFAESKQSEGQERPAQLDKRIRMEIHPIIETRRANRRNGAAYQHRRRRSLTGGHSIITHGRRMEYQRSHSMFLTH